jgi:diguanylate cyclase (GGDEF)-like protein/PAS domain S-box-containing protein
MPEEEQQTMQVHDEQSGFISSSNIFALISSSPLGVCITDEEGKFVFVNRAYCSLYGYRAEELIGEEFTIVVPDQDKDELRALHKTFITSSVEDDTEALTELQTQWTVINRHGEAVTIIANAVLLLGKDGKRSKATFVTDITQQKTAEERLLRANRQLEFHATRDGLTGLLNRRAGLERVSREMAISRTARKPLSVAFLDVDHFKRINDRYGHQTGDEVLQEFAQQIADGIRETDCAIRYGGEEILIVMPGTTDAMAVTIMERLRTQLSMRALSSQSIAVTFSAGIAGYGGGGRRTLLADADQALYAAKHAGRNSVHSATARTQGKRSSAADRMRLDHTQQTDRVAEG